MLNKIIGYFMDFVSYFKRTETSRFVYKYMIFFFLSFPNLVSMGRILVLITKVKS